MLCKLENCKNKSGPGTRGWCWGHYRRWLRYGDPEAVINRGKTTKERHGKNFHKRAGTTGGSKRTRGYFGTLKDQGKTEELKAIAKSGVKKSNEVQAKSGWDSRKHKNKRAKAAKGSKASVLGGKSR